MRIKKNLLKPAVLLSTVCLFLAAGGTAEAAELLGIHASDVDDLMDTSTILLIDTSLGTSIELADTGLSRVAEGTDSSAVNGPAGPNGLAYDTVSGKAYFASVPNSGGGAPILYSVVVDPPGGAPVFLGSPLGRRLFDAAFFDGKYWYIDGRTDDLRSISFDPMTGLLASDVLVADILAAHFPGHTFGFGDIAIQDGILYGAGRRNLPFILGGPIVFFTVDLSDPTLSYVEHQTDDPATPPLQLAFGGEGTLFGQTGALTGEQDLYYVSLVPATLGERGLVLVDFDGGPYTDMSAFNPLCACLPSVLCHLGNSAEGEFQLFKSQDVIDSHLDHGDCLQEDATAVGAVGDLNACTCPEPEPSGTGTSVRPPPNNTKVIKSTQQ